MVWSRERTKHFSTLSVLQHELQSGQRKLQIYICFGFTFGKVSAGLLRMCYLVQHTWKLFHRWKPVSTVFWKCREELCDRKPHCALIQVKKHNGDPVWVNGGRVWHVPVCFRTLSSLFLVGLHLFRWDIFVPPPCPIITGQMRVRVAVKAAVHREAQCWKLRLRTAKTIKHCKQSTWNLIYIKMCHTLCFWSFCLWSQHLLRPNNQGENW